MGVIKELALAPLAPLRLTMWVSEKVAEETDRQQNSQAAVISRLRDIEAAVRRGEISAAEARKREDQIISSRIVGAGVPTSRGARTDHD
jgi:Gas vesicle protein G